MYIKLRPKVNTEKPNITEKIKGTGNYKEREVIYPERCSKHKMLHLGHTGEQLSEHLSKHRCDIKSRSDNSELAKHFRQNHKINDNRDVTILQNNIKTAAARRHREEKWVFRLKTLALYSLNNETGDILKRCKISTNSVTNSALF